MISGSSTCTKEAMRVGAADDQARGPVRRCLHQHDVDHELFVERFVVTALRKLLASSWSPTEGSWSMSDRERDQAQNRDAGALHV